jgi:transposase
MMTELAVERDGHIVMRDRVPTDIRSLGRFLRSVSGRKIMVIEEGTMAGWLYRNLKSKVDEFIVCDPRRNKIISSDGDKDDKVDAADLARLLRGGYIRRIYHSADEDRVAFKEVTALYHDRVRECVRQMHKIRDCCRSHGIKIPPGVTRKPLVRTSWLSESVPVALAGQLSIRWHGYDAVAQQVHLAQQDMMRRSQSYPIIGLWQELPGVGPVRAATLFAYLDTPWRFGSVKKLWKYCGVGLQHFSSGSDKEGFPKRGTLRLFRFVNRRLKDVVLGAALNAVCQGQNPFADHYARMVRNGVSASNARHTVARKMLSVMWGMWKTHSRYDERLV